MRVKIEKSTARGKITAPPSKSMAHRLLIAAALCDGVSVVHGISTCDDVLATIDCLSALGAKIEYDGICARVRGFNPRKSAPQNALNARESGSTLRFMIPIAMMSETAVTFEGAMRLFERPMTIYERLCKEFGYKYTQKGPQITVKGPLESAEMHLEGNVSSQFISGLLFALPLCSADSRIHLTTKLESASYVELTRSALKLFGVSVDWENESTLYIRGNQKYEPTSVEVEGDYSGAAFIDALSLFGGEVTVDGLLEESLQGDKIYKAHFDALSRGAATISLEDCPDLAPILFTVAAAKVGGHFTDTRRLKLKESDRAEVMAEELRKFGADITVEENSVTVKKAPLHAPSEMLYGHNDHRIVMSLAILASLYGGEIDGAEAVKKSYPDFFRDITRLGIKADIYEA